jgi:phosphoribosylformylglycinamidine synthase
VVGEATGDGHLTVTDAHFGVNPVDMEMEALLGKPPRMTRDVTHQPESFVSFDATAIELKDAAYRLMRLPTIADKTFLISIGDRSVGGMTARDQMVGPWQVPVADVAVTTMGYQGYLGEAFAMGERTPLAVLDAPASGRMAIGEALTNLAAADIGELGKVKLSANWMAPCGVPGEDARLFDTVEGISELCKQIGVSIPVGKDSLSMRTAWEDGGVKKQVVSPLSLSSPRLPRSTTCARRKRRNWPSIRAKPNCCCSTSARTASAAPAWPRCITPPAAMRRMSMIRPSSRACSTPCRS